MMQLGAKGVFVGSGIFKSGNPEKRAAAIVQAVTNYTDAKLIAALSEDLGEAMVGINEQEIALIMEERGKYEEKTSIRPARIRNLCRADSSGRRSDWRQHTFWYHG